MSSAKGTSVASASGALQINPAYARPQVAGQIKSAFLDNEAIPNIKLGQILAQDAYGRIKQIAERTTLKRHVAALECRFSQATLRLAQLTKALAFINPIFGTQLKDKSWKLVSITWKDYSMILDTQELKAGFDIILDITDDFPENAGGDIVYTTGGEQTVEIPASSNTLIVVRRSAHTKSFLRYANHYAKDKKRLFLIQHISG